MRFKRHLDENFHRSFKTNEVL